MLNEQDYDKFFSDFNNSSNQGSGIKEVYSIMPFLTQQQIKIYVDGIFFAEKWDLKGVKEYLETIVNFKKQNRNLGFMPSVKNFLKYATLEEKVRNIKIQSSSSEEK